MRQVRLRHPPGSITVGSSDAAQTQRTAPNIAQTAATCVQENPGSLPDLQRTLGGGGMLSVADILNLMSGVSGRMTSPAAAGHVGGIPNMAPRLEQADNGRQGQETTAKNGTLNFPSLALAGRSSANNFRDVCDYVTLAP